jgi:Tfp pilus assembly protein PilW
MNCRNCHAAWRAGWSNDRGVCLAEFMVSLTAGAIVFAASLTTFTLLQAQTVQQQRSLAQQQDVRVGLEVFEQEVRLAATDSILMATEQELRFLADINNQQTTLTSAIVAGQSILPVLDGSGWAKGKSVRICSGQSCASHSLLRDGQRQQLTLAEPVASAFAAGASVEVINQVRYYTKVDEQHNVSLMRMVDGGASVLVAGLKDVRLTYWDEDGRSTSLPAIKRVVIEMVSKSSIRKSVREVSLRS